MPHRTAIGSADRIVAVLSFAGLALLHPGILAAQQPPAGRVTPVAGEIRVDGLLDERAWADASPIGPLTMIEPIEGSVPSAATEVRVLTDRNNLYVGIVAHDPSPGGLVSFAKARDSQLSREDHIRVVLGPYRDGRSGYVFAVNPGGARYDALIANGGDSENVEWDAVWEARTRRDDRGWTVEMRIPVRSLTFDATLEEWGFNVERRIERLQEVSRWSSPFRDARIAQISRAGTLSGMPRFETGMGLTVRPSLSTGVLKAGSAADWAGDAEPSIDVFQRLGSNVTAVGTINTDFAETEVDTRRTNLTRFPLFFPEKRTFFLEGADIFDFGVGMTTFHSVDLMPFFSRRIGLIGGSAVPLRAGGKLSGRAGATNFGALITRTGAVDELADGQTLGVVRLRQNLLDESSVGVLATFGDPEGQPGSWLAGGDLTYRTSRFAGSKNFMVGAWGLASAREGLRGDGTAFGAKIDYPNDVWNLSLTWKRLGDAFEPSLGFVPRNGVHIASAGINYRLWSPLASIRNMFFEFVPVAIWDLDGRLETYQIFTAPVNWRFESGERFEFNVMPMGERLRQDFPIADGVVIPAGDYDWVRYRAELDIAARRALSGRVTWWFGPFYDGDVSEFSVRAEFRPSDVVALELSGTRNDGSMPAGDFVQQVLGARLRVNLSPDLQVSSLAQYERESREFGANTRVRWTFNPLGELFFVYNYNAMDLQRSWTLDSSQLLLKVQYALRY